MIRNFLLALCAILQLAAFPAGAVPTAMIPSSGGGVALSPATIASNGIMAARSNRFAYAGTSAVGNQDSYARAFELIANVRRTKNGGQPGQNSTTILNSLVNSTLVWSPGLVLLDIARNDLPASLATAQTNTARAIQEARKSGALVYVATAWGDVNSTAGAPTARATSVNTYNAWLVSYVAGLNDAGVKVFDTNALLFNADTSPKLALVSTTSTSTITAGAAAVTIPVASVAGVSVGMQVFDANAGVTSGGAAAQQAIVPGATVISINTGTPSVTISIPTSSAGTLSSGQAVAFHAYFKDYNHPGPVGSMVLAQAMKAQLTAAGWLNGFGLPSPLINTSTDNLLPNGTLEGTVTSGLAAGIQSSLAAGNLSVITDVDFRGKAQRISIPAGTAAGVVVFQTQSLTLPVTVRGHRLGYHRKLKAIGLAAAAVLNCQTITTPLPRQYPANIGSTDSSAFYANSIQAFDGVQDEWGEAVAPEFSATFQDLCTTTYAVPAGATPPVIEIGEVGLFDIDDPIQPRTKRVNVTAVTAAYTALTTDEVITADATTAAFAVTLPTCSVTNRGLAIGVVKIDASANAVTYNGVALGTQGQGTRALCTGSAWVVQP